MATRGRKKSDKEKKKELLEKGSVLSAHYDHSRKTRQIIEWFREGLTDKEIYIKILQENPNLKESSATVYLRSAKASFREEFILDRKFVIVQHVKRYDRDILVLSKHEPRTSSYSKFQEEKTQAYLDMINLLQKKEKVLGFHRKTTQLKIKNNVNINLVKTKKTFDFSQLTWEEKLELFNFINKAQIFENEKLVLSPNKNKIEDEELVEDVQHEVIEEINVELIKEKEDSLPPLEFTQEHLVEKDKNIIDATKGVKKEEGKDLDRIKGLLLGNLLK